MSCINEECSTAAHPEACITGTHYCLITVLNINLVEHARDVIADCFFREAERSGNLRVVQTLSNPFEDSALTCCKLVERQSVAARDGRGARFREKPAHFVDESWPSRLVAERHMVFGI